MPHRGCIKNGLVEPVEPFPWPEGTEVTVDVATPSDNETPDDAPPTLYEQLKPLIGKATGLPADLAENHDHYLHGRPKK